MPRACASSTRERYVLVCPAAATCDTACPAASPRLTHLAETFCVARACAGQWLQTRTKMSTHLTLNSLWLGSHFPRYSSISSPCKSISSYPTLFLALTACTFLRSSRDLLFGKELPGRSVFRKGWLLTFILTCILEVHGTTYDPFACRGPAIVLASNEWQLTVDILRIQLLLVNT